MSNFLKISLGLLVSGICLVFAFRGFNFHELMLALTHAKWQWLLPAFLLLGLSYAFRSLRWQILLKPVKAIAFRTIFMILSFGFLTNNILPMRLGELARVYGLKKLEGIRFSSGIGTVALERIMDLLGVIFVISLSMSLLPHDKLPIRPLIALFLFSIIFIIAALFVFEKKGKELEKKPGWLGKGFGFLKNITNGFSALKSPGKIVWLFILTFLVWITDTIVLSVVSRVFNLNLSVIQSAAVITGISFGVMIPAAPGYVGTYELFAKETLVFLGFPVGPALSFVIVIHFFQLLVTFIFGLPGLIKIGLSGLQSKENSDSNTP